VDLPGRGTTVVREWAGPPGAPVVVLVHGVTLTADLNWSGVQPTLGQRFRVIAFDQRGHGRGPDPGPSFRLEDCADDIAALAEVLGAERVTVVGYSAPTSSVRACSVPSGTGRRGSGRARRWH
jgi:pimeloyl-ACP methyl ester carboxylesterase